MKKILKLFVVFALVFLFAFINVNAQTEPDPDPVSVEIIPVVAIKGNNNSLGLTWGEDPNAIKYVVQRSTDSKKGFKTIANVQTGAFTDKKLTYGTKYYYRVRACDATKCTAYSDVVGKKVVPNKVMDVTAKPYSTKVKLAWTATKNSGYYIYSSTDGKTYKKVATIKDRDTVAYKVKGLKSNKLYYFYVVAYQKVGKKIVTGYKSDVISIKTAPAKPAVALSSNYLYELRMTVAAVKGATRYELYYYDKDEKAYEYYYDIEPEDFYEGKFNTYFYVDQPYVNQYYRVRACADTVCGDIAEVKGHSVLTKPVIYSLRAGSKVSYMSFDGAYDGDGYEIYRATSKNGSYKKIKTIKDADITEFKDSKLTNGRTYYYKVRAYIKIGKKVYYSSYSKVRAVKIGSPADSAYQDAKAIAKEGYFSKKGLIDILVKYLGYKETDAKKGVEKLKIDYKANALKQAKVWIYDHGATPTEDGLRQALLDEGFTASEAAYALSKININFREHLEEMIQRELTYGVSRQQLINWYSDDEDGYGYTSTEIAAIIDEMEIDFNEQALLALENYYSDYYYEYGVSSTEAREALEERLFEDSEIEYAFTNTEIDWVSSAAGAYQSIEYNLYSKAQVMELLTGEYYRFTEEEVEAALTRLEINFNEVALEKANQLLEYSYSKQELEMLLKVVKFTDEEVEYALENIEVDFVYNAYYRLNELIDDEEDYPGDRVEFVNYLHGFGFTDDEITGALNLISEEEWVEFCKNTMEDYVNYYNSSYLAGVSPRDLRNIMKNEYDFTNDEIDAAIEEISVNFTNQAILTAYKLLPDGIYSPESMKNLLVSSGYTTEQATAAVASTYLDFDEECVEYITANYLGQENVGTIETIRQDLLGFGFTESNIDYAFEKTDLEAQLN